MLLSVTYHSVTGRNGPFCVPPVRPGNATHRSYDRMATLLTAPAIAKLKAGPKRRMIKDAGAQSLYLVVQPSGHKSWMMRFRRHGKPAKLVLGPLDLSGREFEGKPVTGMPLTLAAARRLAGDILH